MDNLTRESFSANNRTKRIGNSMYRICNTAPDKGTGNWYIHESYNTGREWAQGRAFHNESLDEVINDFNALSREKEIISKHVRTEVKNEI